MVTRLTALTTGSLLVALAMPSAAIAKKPPSAADPPAVSVVVNKSLSTQSRLVLDISLPGVAGTRLVKKVGPDGKTYFKVATPGLTTSFDPRYGPRSGLGSPGLPALSIPFAIPEAADGSSGDVAGVSVTVPKAWYRNTFPKYRPFPASYEGLDAEEFGTEPSVFVGQGITSCANTDHDTPFACWGMDSRFWDATNSEWLPANAFRLWRDALQSGDSLNDAVAAGGFESVAVGESGVGTSASSLCAVGGNYFVQPGAPDVHALNCFGDQGTGWDDAAVSDLGTEAVDVKEVGASAALTATNPDDTNATPMPSEFCLLRNVGNTGIWQHGDGEVHCFGRADRARNWADPPMTDPDSGLASHYTQLSVGFNHACALVASGLPRCWGDDWDSNLASIPGPLPVLKKVEAGHFVDCGIKAADDTLICWGVGGDGNDALTSNPLPAGATGPVKDISISESGACVVKATGELLCFRFDSAGSIPAANPLESLMTPVIQGGRYKSVEVGGRASGAHACAVTIANKVACWGSNTHSEVATPESVNQTIGWNDPLFADFINADIAPGLPLDEQRPFILNESTYTSPEPIPSGGVSTQGGPVRNPQSLFGAMALTNPDGSATRLRGLGLGQIHVFGAQYESRYRLLRLFSKVRIQIDFSNVELDQTGKAVYGTVPAHPGYGGPSTDVVYNSLVNAEQANLGSLPTLARRQPQRAAGATACGEEMIVIAPREFSSAASAFVDGKNRQGMLSRYFPSESVGGDSPDAIRDFVQGEVAKSGSDGTPCITPAYLTIIGNTGKVPTFLGDSVSPSTPGDIDYSLPARNVYVPDLAVGRIPATTAADAQAMVDKILAYESTSPSSSPLFFNNVTLTSFFQNPVSTANRDQRGFVRSAEQLRAALISKLPGYPGKTVERLYSTPFATGRTKLLQDDLGRPFPKDIQTAQNVAPWSLGTQAGVVKSVNSGRFLMISRDHGDFDRIFNPAYGTFSDKVTKSAVDQLANGTQTPVAWLIACLTGKFDSPGTPSLAEQLLAKRDGGMVGVLAASRVSPSEPNNSLLLALADSIWTKVLPTGGEKPIYRMGDILNSAKLAVLMSGGPSASVDINNEMRLYNWFGDPSMPIWTTQPTAIPTTGVATAVSDSGVLITIPSAVAEGATVALLADDVPVARSTVVKGKALLTPSSGVPTGTSLKVVFLKDQSLPTTVVVR